MAADAVPWMSGLDPLGWTPRLPLMTASARADPATRAADFAAGVALAGGWARRVTGAGTSWPPPAWSAARRVARCAQFSGTANRLYDETSLPHRDRPSTPSRCPDK